MLGCLFCWAMATVLLFGEYFNSLLVEQQVHAMISQLRLNRFLKMRM